MNFPTLLMRYNTKKTCWSKFCSLQGDIVYSHCYLHSTQQPVCHMQLRQNTSFQSHPFAHRRSIYFPSAVLITLFTHFFQTVYTIYTHLPRIKYMFLSPSSSLQSSSSTRALRLTIFNSTPLKLILPHRPALLKHLFVTPFFFLSFSYSQYYIYLGAREDKLASAVEK